MARYVYESIQNGLFNFTIPGKDRTVHLFKGSKVTVDQKLAGGYLRVLKLVEEIPDEEPPKEETKTVITKPRARVEDKITKVEEVVEPPKETLIIEVKDDVTAVKEEEVEEVKEEPKPAPKKKSTTRSATTKKSTTKKTTTPRKRRATTKKKVDTTETPKSE